MVFPLFDIRIRWKRIKNRAGAGPVHAILVKPVYVYTLVAATAQDGMRARTQVAQSRFRLGGRQRWIHLLQVCRYVHVVGIRALDWRRPASREGRDASQERTLILNRGPSCSERQSNERVF